MSKPLLYDITVEITNKCNLHCTICGIWSEKRLYEISAKDFAGFLEKILQRFRVRSVSVTGGEPFLHSGIKQIIRYLLLLRLEGRVEFIGLYTNGTATGVIAALLEANRQFLKGISIGISIDGREKIHDVRRGVGAYKKMMRTVKLIATRFQGEVDLELKFTAGKDNHRELFPVYEIAVKNGIRFSPKLAEQDVVAYYHRVAIRQKCALNVEDDLLVRSLRQQMLAIIKTEALLGKKTVDVAMLRLFVRLLSSNGKAIRSCKTPEKCLFVTSRGDVYPCLYMSKVDNIYRDVFLSKEFFSKRRDLMRLGAKADCPRCFAYHGFLKRFNAGLVA